MKEYTDQKFFYKEVPVDYDGVARLKRIKGNSIAFNQLVNNGNFAVSSGWSTVSSASLTISNNIANITTVNAWSGLTSSTGWSLVSGHKYLFSASYKIQTNNYEVNVYSGNLFDFSTIPCVADNQWHTIQQIIACTQSGQSTRPSFDNRTASGSYSVKNIMLIDLTQMFGAGKEPTVNEFKSLFPLSYYSYQSTLLPFKGTGIKTVGKNLFTHSVSSLTTNGITFTPQNDGSVKVSGTATSNAYYNMYNWETNSFLPVNESLKLSGGTNQVRFTVAYRNTDGSGTVEAHDTGNGATITIPSADKVIYSALRVLQGTTIDTVIYPMVTFADAEQTFEPYKETITDLPTLTYFPNGMNSVGEVYDELIPTKAVTRLVKYTVTGTEEIWSWGQGYNNHYGGSLALPSSLSRILKGGVNTNGIASRGYTVNFVNNNMTIYLNTNADRMIIINDAFTSQAQWIQGITGLEVVLELATPTETDINTEVFYPVYQYGTEQILPINGATPTTAPIWCDIEYYNQIEGEIPYRKFWLVNGNGEKWNLTEKEIKSFLNNPSGLGFRKSIEITRYGERANKINEVYDFPQPQGELLFYDSANSSRYDKYYEFTRFVMNQPITLYYQIPVSYNSMIADTYKLDCEVTELQKTESKTDRIMTTQIVFSGLGFYEGEEIEINGTGTTYTIENKGDFPVGFEITLEGSLMNPYITLSQDGEMYGEAKFDDTTAFSSVYVDSKDGEQNIVLKQSGSILPNPLSYQDLSISNGSIYVTFVKLLRGVTELTIGRRSGSLTGVKIKYSPKYRSV